MKWPAMWHMSGANMLIMLLLLFSMTCSVTSSVIYDGKSLIINGQRRILISGSIHYPRSTPEMWPDLIQKAKDGGLDVIQTYVFWSGHEPSPGQVMEVKGVFFQWKTSVSVFPPDEHFERRIDWSNNKNVSVNVFGEPTGFIIYYFEDRFDLVRFIKVVQQAGLYVHLRIGPYVCAEWNLGGFPVWLKYVPGIEFRTDNEPFKAAMQKFTEKIVSLMKAEMLFESQGGPIILSQIENEYRPVEWTIGAPGKAYLEWAAKMAVGLNTGVPWVMCKQDDAPDPLIDTCNGYYCEGFQPDKEYKPKMWTEAWTGWYTEFGGALPHRPVEDLAFAVARFIQNNGSFIDYYMYHGGTNFGRTAGLFIATSYDYDAPLDEYGLPREPKWGHLRDLHKAIKLCEPALVSAFPTVTSLGKNQEAHVFNSQSQGCAAFLSNYDPTYSVSVTFQSKQYELPPWSISILPDCKTSVFNTAQIGTQGSQTKMIPADGAFSWQSYTEQTASADDADATTLQGLLEQISITRDASDYLWYTTNITIGPDEGFLKTGQYPVLNIWSAGHALHVFINGQLAGTVYGGLKNPKISFSGSVKLGVGVNKLAILSVSVGLTNVGIHYETWNVGVLGPVTLGSMNSGTWNLSQWNWSYKVGLKGEALRLDTVSGSSSVEWAQGASLVTKQPLTWYKTTFNAPAGNNPLALDMSTMGKGQIWINGRSIGRHWPRYIANGNCGDCNYAGTFNENKCRSNCGEPTQKWYHVPRSWLNPSGNFLVIFEEWGGDPSGIGLVKRTTESVCADIFENQPSLHDWHIEARNLHPKAHLWCPQGGKISDIKFASYGTPQGTCGNYQEGSCHAWKSYNAFKKNCIGKQSCSVAVVPEDFGGDPCPGVTKKLSVEAVCDFVPSSAA